MSIEDLIPDEKVVLTISHAGYIKRTLTFSNIKFKVEVELVTKLLQLEMQIS